MNKKWEFAAASVSVSDTKLSVTPTVDWKSYQKTYGKALDTLDKKAKAVLQNNFVKGKTSEAGIDKSTSTALSNFFSKLGTAEGVTAVELAAQKEQTGAGYEEPAGSTYGKGTGKSVEEESTSAYKVRVQESMDFRLDYDGKIVDSKVGGMLLVKNEGTKHRIWDIDITLTGGDNVEGIDKELHIPELEPGEDWKQEYTINVGKEDKPQLLVHEDIDTFPDTQAKSQIFLYDKDSKGQVAQFIVSAENTSDKAIEGIEITKEVPEDFNDVKIKSQSAGKASRDGNLITWKIDSMEPGDKAQMELAITVITNEKKAFTSGEIKAKYNIKDGTFSGLEPDFIDGLADQIHFVDRDERDEEPDTWDCSFVFKNRSEFPMALERYTFVFGSAEEEVLTIDQELEDVVVQSGQEWTSKPWDIKSEEEPTFHENIVYAVVADIAKQLIMSMTLKPIDLRVLALEGEKKFSVEKVASYRETKIDTSVLVTFMGKAPVDKVHIEDTIPADFKNPSQDDIKITIAGKDISDFDVSFDGGEDLGAARKMKIDIANIIDTVGELEDGTQVTMSYPLVAYKPAKDSSYDAPLLFQGFTKPAGTIETTLTPAPITVAHERRKTRVGKSIAPGSNKGDYDIVLAYKNKGDTVKSGIEIADFVPAEFSILNSNLEYEESKSKDGVLLTWTLEQVQPNQEIEVTYSIHGEGDSYSLKNIEAKSFK
jgi:hypothetical protein